MCGSRKGNKGEMDAEEENGIVFWGRRRRLNYEFQKHNMVVKYNIVICKYQFGCGCYERQHCWL
jgi:hypothetical protein